MALNRTDRICYSTRVGLDLAILNCYETMRIPNRS